MPTLTDAHARIVRIAAIACILPVALAFVALPFIAFGLAVDTEATTLDRVSLLGWALLALVAVPLCGFAKAPRVPSARSRILLCIPMIITGIWAVTVVAVPMLIGAGDLA